MVAPLFVSCKTPGCRKRELRANGIEWKKTVVTEKVRIYCSGYLTQQLSEVPAVTFLFRFLLGGTFSDGCDLP